ncbi:MAG TPA: spore gernimation protein GerD [Candidatus Pseudogracilibacillus intestinigallinarum]|uniref:Spore gernimation protein GerD n=1 Tax=Candidatus Pseudogracilibacillus intestinigallinarum TaxID=2838742 RepID=A0A9D1PNQ6_9BACI|nr:spore gernimation protein GerD [Candidatus Pseudogracilibacillus intestinigallinarum]
MIKTRNILLGIILFLTGCAIEEEAREKDYDATKKMVMDIVQTEEGKKAIRDVMRDEEMKKLLVIDADETKQAIEETLSSEQSVDMWKKLFEDPTFIEVFYKSVEDEHKKFMEKLLADPAIQEKVMEILEDPKMTDQFEKLMKSTTYKEHLKKVIEETYETPTFKKRTHDIMKKIVEEKDKDENKKKEKSQKEEAPDDEEM